MSKKKQTVLWDIMSALIGTMTLFFVCACFFDFYFDLNDDVLIQNILSGAYSGTPSGYTMQILYPLACCISLFYKVIPSVQWYGLFLCGCVFLCIFLVGVRLQSFAEKRWKKLVLIALELLLFAALIFYEIIFVQYTVVSAVLGVTGIFLFLTRRQTEGETFFQLLKGNLTALILIWIAFQLRSEMMLLLMPFLCIAFLFQWLQNRNGKQFIRLILVFVIILTGKGVCYAADAAAYHDVQWKEAGAFFDARTEIYDFLDLPDYEDNKEFFDSISLSEEEYRLLENYNYALDGKIDAQCMEQIAEYQRNHLTGDNTASHIKETLYECYYRMTRAVDMPYNVILISLYIATLIICIFEKDLWLFLSASGSFAAHMVCWGYIIFRGRTPDRITHGLYLAEILVLIGFFLIKSSNTKWEKKKYLQTVLVLILTGIGCFGGIKQSNKAILESTKRELINSDWIEFEQYCKMQPENYYVLDVYSTILFSEKMFVDVDNSLQNYDIAGGWIAKSPLYYEKLNNYGLQEIGNALIEKENVYFVIRQGEETKWLLEYYKNTGREIEITSPEMGEVGNFELLQLK